MDIPSSISGQRSIQPVCRASADCLVTPILLSNTITTPDDNIILEIELREAHKELDAIMIPDYTISNKIYYLLDG